MPDGKKQRTTTMVQNDIKFWLMKQRKAFKKMNRAEAERQRQADKMDRCRTKLSALQVELQSLLVEKHKEEGK